MTVTEAMRWDHAGIRRAARPLIRGAGHRVRLPRTDPLLAKGTALRWEESGAAMLAQVWCPAPYVRGYWMLVDAPCAAFPGEMRLGIADTAGRLSLWGDRYNSRGDQNPHDDGSSCHGYQHGGCPGCRRDTVARKLRQLAGQRVRLTFEGDPAYGPTLRWGILREVRAGVAVIDGYQDSSGIFGQYPDRNPDGVEVAVASVLDVQAA